MLQELVWKENVPPKIVTMSVCASTVCSLNKPTDKIYNYNLYITGFCCAQTNGYKLQRYHVIFTHASTRTREVGEGADEQTIRESEFPEVLIQVRSRRRFTGKKLMLFMK